jgi:acyl-CoA synthetase (AMP-forming)/AMP-acid ligase II
MGGGVSVNLGDVLDRIGRTVAPADPAVICDGEVTGWGDFDRRSNALARALGALGLPVGAKVALYMRNCPEYVEALAATFKGRFAHVNVNYRYGGDELLYIFDNSDAEAVIFGGEFAAQVEAIRDRAPRVKLWVQANGAPVLAGAHSIVGLAAGDGAPLDIARSPDDMFLLYTGGTTGMPKGVMWPSATFWGANLGGRAPVYGQEPPATVDALMDQIRSGQGRGPVYVAPPLMHGTGLFSAINALTRGAAVIVTRNPSFDPEQTIAAVDRWRATGLIIVGDAFARPLLDALRATRGRYDVSCLRSMVSSGMMWSPEVKEGLLEFMPDAILADSFGASEATGLGISIASKDSPPREARFDIVSTRVLRDDLTEVTPGSGEVGRIAKFGNLPLGYYKDPEKTAKAYVTIDGERHLISGDHATVEADGTIRLLGRGSHCINSAGEKIYPEEVEEALKTHPAVHDALVFGMPDPRFGQTVAAVASLVDGASAAEAELIAHVRSRLAAYKAPKALVLAPATPRAPNGKADYAAARSIFAAHTQGQT